MTPVQLERMTKYVVGKYFNYHNHYGISMEDFIQEGMEAYLLYIKENKEEPDQNKTYSLLCVTFRRMMNKEIKQSKITSMSDYWHTSSSDSIPNELHEEFNSVQEYLSYELLTAAIETLSESEKYIVYNGFLAVRQKSRHELARELKLTPQRVSQLTKSAENKIRIYFEENSY